MKNFKIILSIIVVLFFQKIQAQELLFNVIIDDTKYQLPDRSVFLQMKSDIENFLNNRIWTKDTYEAHEKINCNLLLTIDENSTQTAFFCQAQIQSSRPVYGAVYQTVLLNFPDKNFSFNYTPGMQIEYNDNSYTNELTTLLSFYSYIILGMDYDSFSKDGGKSFYLLANQAMTNNPKLNDNPGWSNSTNEINTRFWLIENLLSAQFVNFHQALYDYHRIGIDKLGSKKEDALKSILSAITEINNVRNLNQSSVLVTAFMLAKKDELLSIIAGASLAQKQEIVPILSSLDPLYTEKYQNLLK